MTTNDNYMDTGNVGGESSEERGNMPSYQQTEDIQSVNGYSQEKSPEQELQEIYAEQQILDSRIKENKRLLEDVDIQLKLVKRQYKKLGRSKRRIYFLCICLLTVFVGVSVYRAKVLIHDKEESWKQYYRNQYSKWEAKAINEYYDRIKEEKRPHADRLNENNRDEINAYIASLDRVVGGVSSDTIGSVTCLTNTEVYELEKYTIGSVNTAIFPGAVLKGESLFQGTVDYTVLPLERMPMYLVSDQIGGNSVELANVSYQGTMEFLNSCAAKNEGQAAKEWCYYMQTFKTSKELKASLGIEVPSIGGLNFDSSNHTETSSVAVIYEQRHYTVSAEPQKTAADYFQIGSDMAALGDYEPAYVSSVDYGRMIVVLIQGNMSSQELGAKVSACIKGVDIAAGLTNIRMDSEITSHIFQYGGKQKDAGLITDTSEKKLGIVDKWNGFWNGAEDRGTVESRINDFIQSDALATNSVPIGYTLKYLTDNSFVPAMMVTGQRRVVCSVNDVVKKVVITTNRPVDWDDSDMTGMLISASENADSYIYEYLWNSSGADVLNGKLDYENEKNVKLRISEYLPNGKTHIDMGNFEYNDKSAWGFTTTKTDNIYADVSITDY